MLWLIVSGALHNFNMYALGAVVSPFLVRFHPMSFFDGGCVSPELTQHVRLFQLARMLLNPQVENFLSHFAFTGLEFLDSEFLDFGDFHGQLFRRTMA
jgi:hypothetical protein